MENVAKIACEVFWEISFQSDENRQLVIAQSRKSIICLEERMESMVAVDKTSKIDGRKKITYFNQ